MKARLTGVFLCIGAFVLSMFLLLHLIENPMTEVPDLGGDEPSLTDPSTEDGGDSSTEDVSGSVTSIEGVMAVAKETQSFFAALSTDLQKSTQDLDAMLKKWDNAALYLSERAADEAGAAYYTALAAALRTYTGEYPTSAADFSAKAAAALRSVRAAEISEQTPSGRYPELDASENGEIARGLLRLYLERAKTTGSVTVTYGGEVAMGDYIGSSAYQNLYAVENAPNPLAALVPLFATDDVSIVALNAPLTTYTVPEVAATEAFRGSSAEIYAKHLKNAGVDAVILSTCHIRDFGETGYNDTKAALEKAGLSVVEDGATTYLDTTAGKVALIAFDLTDDGNVRYTEIPKAKIREAKSSGAAMVITYFHTANAEEVTSAMANTLRDAAANGADLVLSSHEASFEGILLSTDTKIPLILSPGRLSYAAAKEGERDTFLYRQSFSLVEGDTADHSRLIFCADNRTAADNAPYAPALLLDAENVARIRSALSAALPNFQGRVAEGDLTYLSISE